MIKYIWIKRWTFFICQNYFDNMLHLVTMKVKIHLIYFNARSVYIIPKGKIILHQIGMTCIAFESTLLTDVSVKF